MWESVGEFKSERRVRYFLLSGKVTPIWLLVIKSLHVCSFLDSRWSCRQKTYDNHFLERLAESITGWPKKSPVAFQQDGAHPRYYITARYFLSYHFHTWICSSWPTTSYGSTTIISCGSLRNNKCWKYVCMVKSAHTLQKYVFKT